MEYRKINAIVHVDSLQAVEEVLQHLGAAAVAVTRIKGYGDYKNFYNPEWISDQARIEVFVSHEQVEVVVEAICDAAHAGLDSDGMVAVLPVETLIHIRDFIPRPKS
ncbi:P-II family nitrogen regulator [Oleiagrimonas sp. MCCC 1A03011]|uniref:P-II family nitrogen regulator n=1 Tax=Oleiagrimonas sp. MCCC 1A03011 TaxID=1926883 RepID=UPI000DC26A90|nr:P-II family nitrogen regulator [Oleiagrimonas sp. MCCC 1A03011]RAP56097.1 hypothetical protein BTJ49_14755 [Oleiagrimonas sp. MCCC 1A03011]